MDPDTDPGWGSAIPHAFLGLIPGWGPRHFKKRSRALDGLTTLRALYLSFVIGIALVGVVVAVLEASGGDMGSTAERPVAAVVVAVGVASLAARRLLRRPFPCDSESALAAAYRQRFFLQIAVAEAAALVAFVGYIVSSAGWLYPVGAFFTAIGFARLAPTAANLDQDQGDLRRHGCALSLRSALRQSPERR